VRGTEDRGVGTPSGQKKKTGGGRTTCRWTFLEAKKKRLTKPGRVGQAIRCEGAMKMDSQNLGRGQKTQSTQSRKRGECWEQKGPNKI